MSNQAFLTYILLLFSGIMTAFFHFKHHFSGVERYKEQTQILHDQVRRERLNVVLAQHQLKELRQHVAEVFPSKGLPLSKEQEGFAYRNLASIVSLPTVEKYLLPDASSLFERGKQAFRQEKYEEANESFQTLIENYPTSTHVVKSHFLLAESLFRLQRKDHFINTVDTMVTQYPDSEMTGFAMLRLGELFEVEERPEDALELYSLILKKYSNHDLRRQAALYKKGVE